MSFAIAAQIPAWRTKSAAFVDNQCVRQCLGEHERPSRRWSGNLQPERSEGGGDDDARSGARCGRRRRVRGTARDARHAYDAALLRARVPAGESARVDQARRRGVASGGEVGGEGVCGQGVVRGTRRPWNHRAPIHVDDTPWSRIEIVDDATGCPRVVMAAEVHVELCRSLAVTESAEPVWHVSISHDGGIASAVAVLDMRE